MAEPLSLHLPGLASLDLVRRVVLDELGVLPLLPAEAPTAEVRGPDAIALAQLVLTLPISALATLTLAERLQVKGAVERVQARLRGAGVRLGGLAAGEGLVEEASVAAVLAAADGGGRPEPAWQVFLSYASADADAVGVFHEALEAAGCSVYRDRTRLEPGEQWPFAILNAQRCSRATVVLLSPRWRGAFYLQDEVQRAIALHRRGGHEVLPVYLEGVPTEEDVPSGLMGVHGVDVVAEGGLVRAAERVARRVRGLAGGRGER